jgi:hypothetical protein
VVPGTCIPLCRNCLERPLIAAKSRKQLFA